MLLKCKYCGANLEDVFGTVVTVCKYCATSQTIPLVEDESLKGLFNNATDLRLKKEFDKAREVYEKIVKLLPKVSEAIWGLILCKYGVEYVPENGKYIPTLHRPIHNYRITDDPHVSALLDSVSDSEAYNDYLTKINELESLRERLLVARKEKPQYDVFLSCEITNSNSKNNEKTEEYKWAYEIYKRLIERGLRVFFAPCVLRDVDKEPNINLYLALESAKYLIVFASNPQNLTSTWVKNEWERFLSLREIDGRNNRGYKLIINSDFSKDVPEDLREVDYIAHDSEFWFKDVESAVEEFFPHIKNQQMTVTPGKDTVDLGSVKMGDKKLKATETKYTADAVPILRNPYTIHYTDLEDDYTIDDNIQMFATLIESLVKNGHFGDAKYKLNEYLDCFRYMSDWDYKIMVFKLLIDSKSKTLEDFYKDGIQNFNDFELFAEIIKKLPAAEAEEFLTPISEYIVDSIMESANNNAFEYYRILANVNTGVITKLNRTVLRALPYIFNKPTLLMDYANISIPFVFHADIDDYINLCSELVTEMCRNALWDEAKKICDDLKFVDEKNGKVALVSLMIENQSKVLDELMEGIEKENDYFKVEALIPKLSRTGVKHLISVIKNRIIYLLENQRYENASRWVSIAVQTDFEDRGVYFEGLINKCKNIPESDPVFDIIIHTLGEEQKSFFVYSTLEFIGVLVRNGYYVTAKKYCKELTEYNLHEYMGEYFKILQYYLYAEIETPNMSLGNIYKLSDMSIVEMLLLSCSTNYARQELLMDLTFACIDYVDENEVTQDDNVFDVFNKLLTYFPEVTIGLKKQVNTFAEKCLMRGVFKQAKWNYITLIRWDVDYHQAYWGILLADNCCKDESELIQVGEPIDQMENFKRALIHAKENKEALKKYTDTLAQQLHYKKKKSIPKKLMIAGIIAAAVTVGILLIILA